MVMRMAGKTNDDQGPAAASEFRRLIRLDEVSRRDVDVTVVAAPPEREALARRFGITEILALEASLKIHRVSSGVYNVSGAIEAEIIYIGVDAAEAMGFSLNEQFGEIFATPDGWRTLEENAIDDEVDAELVTEDFIDMGEIVAQNLSLALDPVLLEAGAFDDGAITYSSGGGKGDVPEHSFSALEILRGRRAPSDESSGG
jgi:hypothetical protein